MEISVEEVLGMHFRRLNRFNMMIFTWWSDDMSSELGLEMSFQYIEGPRPLSDVVAWIAVLLMALALWLPCSFMLASWVASGGHYTTLLSALRSVSASGDMVVKISTTQLQKPTTTMSCLLGFFGSNLVLDLIDEVTRHALKRAQRPWDFL